MTTYSIQAPDGKTYAIDGPAGATDAQIQSEVMRQNPHLSAPVGSPKGPVKLDPMTTVPQWARENPRLYGVAQAARQTLGPLVEGAGAIGGAALGTFMGPAGALGGAGLGYGIGSGINRTADTLLGNTAPDTASQAFTNAGKDVLTGVALEGGGNILGQVIGKAAPAVGWLQDAMTKNLVKARAGDIARTKIAGADLDAIKALAASAPPELTAAQATLGANNNLVAALGKRAEKNDTSNFFHRNKAAAEEARMAQLQSVTPDMNSALGTRSAASTADYAAAEAAGIDQQMAAAIKPQIDSLMRRPSMEAARAKALELAAEKDISTLDFGSVSGLDWLKKALDAQIGSVKTANTGIDKAKLAALMQTKEDLLATIKQIAPAYDAARANFATNSIPVNQSQLLGEMQSILAKPGGGERAVPMLNALGRGENALIKRSGGDPRYGSIDEVLSPGQMDAVNNVTGELTRDLALKDLAASGQGGLAKILGESKATAELPPSINIITRTVNKALSVLEHRVNASTLDVLEKGMQSGQSFLDVLNTLPAIERNNVLKALKQNAGAQAGQAAVYGTNTLVSERKQSQNSLGR